MNTHPRFRSLALSLTLAIAACAASIAPAKAQDIITFDFAALAGSEATAPSNFNDAGLSAATISRGAGLTASGNAGRFNATTWALTSIPNAVVGNNYMEFTITPNVGKKFSVSTIVVQWQRSATGNTAIALRSSASAYSTDIDGIKSVTDNTSTQTFTWNVTQADSAIPVTYRLYSYAEAVGGSGGPGDGTGNDIVVSGTVSNASASAPVVTDFTPASGPIGTAVTIGGSNFTGTTNVAFNGVAATFSNVTSTNLSATVPVGALSGPISVSTPDGTGASSNSFIIPTVSVILPASVIEGGSGTGEVTVNEAPLTDLEVTLTSSSTNDLTVETPVTIFAATTNSFFNFSAPLDSVIDASTNVTVTPAATGYAPAPGTITVVNVDAVAIPLTSLATNSYTQDFDILGTTTFTNVISPTNGVQTGLGDVVSTNLNGWYAAKLAGSATTNSSIAVNDGSANSGQVYNYGTTSDANRSLGGLASGSVTPGFGALLQNNTGVTINQIIINLTGKFWRSSTTTQNVLTFGYAVVDGVTFNNNNFISAAGAAALPAANVVGPAPVAVNGALDGNDPTNQVLLSNVVIPVTLTPGQTMFVRWQDFDAAGSDAGLAIDDLSLTASTNLATPSLAAVTVNQFALTESQSEVASSVVSEGGSTLTARGFVYSESFFNTNPVIGGPNTTAITNDPPDVSAFTNTISGLLASTAYTVKSFAINAQGTNYSAGTTFNTLAPNPAFGGVYTQSFDGLTNTFFPNGWRCLSTSNVNNYAGDWNSTNAVSAGFYGRTNIPGILGYLHTSSTGILSNRLTLVNNTGGTLTNLFVSYVGEVNTLNPTNNTRFPEWTVVVDGQTNASLAYSTAGGTNAFLSTEVTGLSIPNGSNIVISWSSDRGAGAGSSRMIGMTSVRVATNAAGAPTIGIVGSLTNFSTTVGNASASQSFNASGTDLVDDITVTAPTDYEVSLDDSTFSSSVVLTPSGGTVSSTPVYVRIAATAPIGNPAGQVNLASAGATDQNIAVTGTVSSGGGGFTSWVAGGPTNSANVLKYAIGGATSPTADDGIASQTAVTSSNLSITAIVRTNDPSLDVFGEGITNLSVGPWSTNGVTQTASTNQVGVPAGTERQIFSIDRGTNNRLFLRLDAILQP